MFYPKFSKAVLCAVVLATISVAAPAGTSIPVSESSASVAPARSSSAISVASTASSVDTSSVLVSAVPSSVAPTSASGLESASDAARHPSSTASSVEPSATVPYASDDPNGVMWDPSTNGTPQAIRGSLGATVLGPQDVAIVKENPDLLAPPTTDSGTVGNAKWPFSLSHNRLQTGGWARQENVGVMPMATSMAGVNMRLEAGAIRELHWHKTSEWGYILKGTVQVTAVNSDGQDYLGTVSQGDLWYFPPGIPHSLQATADLADGAEFLLVFGDGAFSEDSTFLLTDWLAHVPKDVIAKNFQTNISAFDHIPADELYIFPSTPPADNAQAPTSPQGASSEPYTYSFSKVAATQLSGGSAKVVDSTTFKISTEIAAAEVTVEPGAMREMHIPSPMGKLLRILESEGTARMTLFASSGQARTFNYQAGDVGFVPASFGHYVENTGNTTLRFLEIFNTDRFQDISLNQWLALTPPDLVKAHLQLDDDTIAHLSKTKPTVIGPA
ncbi:hypothetical protein NLI96_g3943 [Meripilus lineatus]|uniref:Cupin type-1 domain-containing protein n=1 Tax=Meripilus lineatus TaxID=2056292 RepID=A0AAD5V626_9APHY|nr:hypothetical protein NLI96_g3943 [Physisporinus lineatus]